MEAVAEENEVSGKTLSDLMAELSKNYKAQQPYKDKLSPLEKEATKIKNELMPLMMKEGIKKTSTKTETVSITEIEAIKIDDITKFVSAIKREGLEHILSIKTTEGKEYKQLKGKEIPGTHTEVVSRHIRISAIKK